MSETFAELIATRRWCYTIPTTGFVPGRGWRVSVAIENVEGHWPTGDLNFNDTANHVEPWFWGDVNDSYAVAEQTCAEQNQKIGLEVDEVWAIVSSTVLGARAQSKINAAIAKKARKAQGR